MKANENSKNSNLPVFPKLTQQDIVKYVKDRFDELKQNASMKDLVKFHTSNKYFLMACNQEKLQDLGNIVANHKKLKIDKVISNYEIQLKSTLEYFPTVKTHINVLMHIFGFFGKYFNQQEKRIFMKLIQDYRKGKVTLGKILSEVELIIFKFNSMYLISQTYFLLYSDPKLGMTLTTKGQKLRENTDIKKGMN